MPTKWLISTRKKKVNVFPFHIKCDRQTIGNYHIVSLPAIQGEIFECLLYDTLIFFQKYLLSANQFVFRPGDSCIDQLLSINHETLSVFDMEVKVHRIFLDISKAFDKVWHDGLIFQLCQNGICGEMINILEDFLSDRKQRINPVSSKRT